MSLLTKFLHRQLEAFQYKPAIALIDNLLTELKRLDDKMILTEVHLLESRVYRGIGNLAKAKVRLNAPRSLFETNFISLAGSLNFLPNSRQLDLLPSTPPSPTRPPI